MQEASFSHQTLVSPSLTLPRCFFYWTSSPGAFLVALASIAFKLSVPTVSTVYTVLQVLLAHLRVDFRAFFYWPPSPGWIEIIIEHKWVVWGISWLALKRSLFRMSKVYISHATIECFKGCSQLKTKVM